MGPVEKLTSIGLETLTSKFMMSGSYRVMTGLLNESLYRTEANAFHPRTMCEKTERLGGEMRQRMEEQSQEILSAHGMNGECAQVDEAEKQEPAGSNWKYSEEEIRKVAAEYNEQKRHDDEKISDVMVQAAYERACCATYACADDIGVHKQKEQRRGMRESEKGKQGKKSRHYVENTVVSVHTQGAGDTSTQTRFFAGVGMQSVFTWVLAYLLESGSLQGKKLMFFSDGAANIRAALKAVFGFRPYEVILDWYHLCKKLGELLSMSICGTKERNEILDKLKRILWVGNVEGALRYLEGIDQRSIKSQSRLDSIAVYLNKHREEIPCYAIRDKLGLRNSSQAVECANFILVAERQKIGGMSWSSSGSEAQSILRAVYENGDTDKWFHTHSFSVFHNHSDNQMAA